MSELLDDKLEEFRYRYMQWSAELVVALERDGAKISYARPWKDMVWFLWLLLPEGVQQTFGTAAQVLLVAVRGEVHARDLERARIELYRSQYKLDLDLLIVCDDSPSLAERLARMPGKWGQWVPWPASRDGMPSLVEQLRLHLPRVDIFEEKNPVRGRSVIGRDAEVADLTHRVERGESAGVFGLRKVGKTSTVRAVTDGLDPISAQLSQPGDIDARPDDSRTLVCWLDVQRVYDRTAPRLFSTLAEVIRKRLVAQGLTPPTSTAASMDCVNQLLEFGLSNQSLSVCVVLDEYDYMFGGGMGQPPIPGVAGLFRMLRGWAQETGRLSIIVIGRDPLPFQRPELEGFPNPMLGWFVVRWLGPLTAPATAELLVRLGRRVGLEVGAETVRAALVTTGGHPLLLRHFGSALLDAAVRLHKPGWPQPTDDLANLVSERLFGRFSVATICEEIVALLSSRFSHAYQKLLSFAFYGIPTLRDVSAWHGKGIDVLRNFGLLLESDRGLWMPEVLLQYVRIKEDKPGSKKNWRLTQQGDGGRSAQKGKRGH